MSKITQNEAENILNRFQKIYEVREKVFRELYWLNKKVYDKKQKILLKKLKKMLNER